MKYVYRAMSIGQNCTKLLQWHEKLYEKVRNTQRQTGARIPSAGRRAEAPASLCLDSTRLARSLDASCTSRCLIFRMAPASSCARWWIARSTDKARVRTRGALPNALPHPFLSLSLPPPIPPSGVALIANCSIAQIRIDCLRVYSRLTPTRQHIFFQPKSLSRLLRSSKGETDY